MGALSSKDKLTLKVSKARVERWNRFILSPPKNFVVTANGKVKPVERCLGIVFAPEQDKPEEVISSDKLDSVHRLSDGYKVRTMAGKLGVHSNAIAARVHSISHTDPDTGVVTTQIVADCAENDVSPRDPAWKDGQRVTVKARANSPFKRAKVETIIIRKGL